MPCQHVQLPGGGFAIVRTSGGKVHRCASCGRVAHFLCDFRVSEKGKTCDRRMCAFHAHAVGRNLHHCDEHYQAVEQVELFEGRR